MNNRGQQMNRPPAQRNPEKNIKPQMNPAQQAQLKQQMILQQQQLQKQQQQQQQQQQQSYPSQVTVPQAVTVLIARLNNLEQKINKISDSQHNSGSESNTIDNFIERLQTIESNMLNNSLSESNTTDNFLDETNLLPIFERLQTIESKMSNDSLETKMNQLVAKIQKLEKDLIESKKLIIKLQGVTTETTSQVASLLLKFKTMEDEIMKPQLKQNILSEVSNNTLFLNIEEKNNVSSDNESINELTNIDLTNNNNC